MKNGSEDIALRLAAAEQQVERSKVVMESLAGFCHALGQPAQVILSSIELLKMPSTEPELKDQVLDICYDAANEIRDILAQMKKKREWVNEEYLAGNSQAGTILSMPEWNEKNPYDS